jgi:hypothetical protein
LAASIICTIILVPILHIQCVPAIGFTAAFIKSFVAPNLPNFVPSSLLLNIACASSADPPASVLLAFDIEPIAPGMKDEAPLFSPTAAIPFTKV